MFHFLYRYILIAELNKIGAHDQLYPVQFNLIKILLCKDLGFIHLLHLLMNEGGIMQYHNPFF